MRVTRDITVILGRKPFNTHHEMYELPHFLQGPFPVHIKKTLIRTLPVGDTFDNKLMKVEPRLLFTLF